MITGLVLKAPTAPVQQVSQIPLSQIPQSEDPNFSIDNVIREASVAHNVDAVLIRSIIAAEQRTRVRKREIERALRTARHERLFLRIAGVRHLQHGDVLHRRER